MNAARVEPRPWSRGRWGVFVALVFGAHVGLIFALSDRVPIVARKPANVPRLRLQLGSSESLELNDPTLFALPHWRGSFGTVWRPAPLLELRPARGSEPASWLELSIEKLGSAFTQFAGTNGFAPLDLEVAPPSRVNAPPPVPVDGVLAGSTWRLGGGLAGRPLLSGWRLPAWPSTGLLTNSEVQILVDAAGQVTSHALLVSSGSKEADQSAQDLARNARFAPLPDGRTDLSLGTLVFEWQTAPLPPTNPPPNP